MQNFLKLKTQPISKHLCLTALTLSLSFASLSATPQVEPIHSRDIFSMPQRPVAESAVLNGKTYSIGNIYGTPAAHTRANEVITEAQGTEKLYNKDVAGTFVLNGAMMQYMETFPVTVVWGDDNKVYFKDIISTMVCDSYVVGNLEGDKITLATDQMVEYDPDYDYGIMVGVCRTEINGDVVDFYYDPDIREYSILVDESGELTLQLPGEPFDGENPPQYVLGLYYSDDLQFIGLSDYVQYYHPSDLEIVEIPAQAEILPYVFIDEFSFAQIVDVAFYGDYLYIRGLSSMLPEATVRARINGNTATISQDEYLGIYMDMYFIVTKVLVKNPDFDENDPKSDEYLMAPPSQGFNLVIDDDRRVIAAVEDDILLSFQPDEDSYLHAITVFGKFDIKYQDTMAGTPANPTGIEYHTEWAVYQGYNDLFFSISNFSTEGILLDENCLYYQVTINGEPLIFEKKRIKNLLGEATTAYDGIPAPQVWMPYLWQNNEDVFKFSINTFDIGIYRDDVETIGVQTLYLYEGEATYSDVVTLDVATGEITETPSSGIQKVENSRANIEGVYNLQGQKMDPNNLQKGNIYIINGKKVVVR